MTRGQSRAHHNGEPQAITVQVEMLVFQIETPLTISEQATRRPHTAQIRGAEVATSTTS